MNLLALIKDACQRCGYPAPTSPTSDANATRMTSFINTTHRQILGTPGLESLRDDTITFSSVAGQSYYGLPPVVARIEGISDRTTLRSLWSRSLGDIRVSDPGLTQTGPSESFIPRGWQQVAVQPTVASELFVKSTSAADTAVIAYVEGIRTGGYPKTLQVTLTGTTAVTFSATYNDFIEVTKFYLSAAAAGIVTLTTVSGLGTELARIQIGQTYARYYGIQLYPTPSSAITIYVDYVRTIPEMSIGTDEPLLPDDFHFLLVEGALIKEWTKRDDDRRVDADRAYTKGLSALKYFVNAPADFLPFRGAFGRGRGYSRFGPWFPATRY